MIFASNNKNKLQEIKQIFNNYEIKSLNDVNLDIDVIEDKETFYENALKKAIEIYEVVKEPVIADDSGLCINYYNDWPGVYTARFLGENKTTQEKNDYIIDKMKDLKKEDRKAKAVCILVYYDGEKIIYGEGILHGYIDFINVGTNKFGFDDIFVLENGISVSSLSMEEKNMISARHLAAIDLISKLEEKVYTK